MIRFTILGEPASKANSRQLVTINKRPAFIKSEKARDYEKTAILQIPPSAKLMLEGPVAVTMRIFYASERPDLDESVILDVLQAKYERSDIPGAKRGLVRKGVYINDRQVREKHVFHGIDRANPRAEIEVRALQPQQPDILGGVDVVRVVKGKKAKPAPVMELVADGQPF